MKDKLHYLKRYGLQREPFRMSPDPAFFFPSRQHVAARKVLEYAIRNDEGFMVLVGPAGSGKTMLLRMILEDIGKAKPSVLIVNPLLRPDELLPRILAELGFKVSGNGADGDLQTALQRVLLNLGRKNKDLLIIVDEAQNMPLPTLEYLRMLSNIETSRKKLLQVLLAGQPGLDRLLSDASLAQLSQRVVVHEHLLPFDRHETIEYVNFRMSRAGRADLGINWLARRAMFRHSRGIPRLINRLMDRTLLLAGADCADKVRRRHILKAASTLPSINTDNGFRGIW